MRSSASEPAKRLPELTERSPPQPTRRVLEAGVGIETEAGEVERNAPSTNTEIKEEGVAVYVSAAWRQVESHAGKVVTSASFRMMWLSESASYVNISRCVNSNATRKIKSR